MRSFIPNKKEHKSDYFKVIDSLEAIPNLKWRIYKENRKITDYWSLHFSYSSKVKKPIFEYLYKDATVFLKRKRNKALNAVLNAGSKKSAQCNA